MRRAVVEREMEERERGLEGLFGSCLVRTSAVY